MTFFLAKENEILLKFCISTLSLCFYVYLSTISLSDS
jgi:hypothetical protein